MKWHVNSPVAASGAAPDLQDTVLLQPRWFRSGISRIFAMIVHESRVLQSLRSQISGAFLRFLPASFFSQFSSTWPFLKFDYPVLRMISRPPQTLSSWKQRAV